MPHDKIYLVSYPKCGITWLRILLDNILSCHFEIPKEDRTLDFPQVHKKYPEFPNIGWTHDNAHLATENGQRNDPGAVFTYKGRLKYRNVKVIFLTRDPRDVVLSQYYQLCYRTRKPFSFSDFSSYLRDPDFGIKRIIDFYQMWYWNHFLIKQFYLIRYEDLVVQPFYELQNLMRFINITVSSTCIEKAINYTEPDNLRKVIMEGEKKSGIVNDESHEKQKVRNPGKFKYLEEMNDADIKFCDELLKLFPAYFTSDK